MDSNIYPLMKNKLFEQLSRILCTGKKIKVFLKMSQKNDGASSEKN